MTASYARPEPGPPPFSGQRLLYVVTGGIQAMFGPSWVSWLSHSYPELSVRCVLTESALRFTTLTAMTAACSGVALTVDAWSEDVHHALHVELAKWPDSILVHPGTFDFVTRLALGRGDSPTMLALQCTSAPMAVCPSLPPGGDTNTAYRENADRLSRRRNLTILPPGAGVSGYDGSPSTGVVAYLPEALAALEDLKTWL